MRSYPTRSRHPPKRQIQPLDWANGDGYAESDGLLTWHGTSERQHQCLSTVGRLLPTLNHYPPAVGLLSQVKKASRREMPFFDYGPCWLRAMARPVNC